VIAGGDSRHHRFTHADIARFVQHLTALAEAGAGLMMTASRRTPPALKDALLDLAAKSKGFFWDGTGENPFVALLSLADFIVVTADSGNMIGEASASGRPVLVFEPSGGHPKLDVYMQGLKAHGIVHPFEGHLVGRPYEPLDSTPKIAEAIAQGLSRHRRALGLPDLAFSLETP
jgi:mitochondrial fission protein ELM1